MKTRGRTLHTIGDVREAIGESVRIYITVTWGNNDAGTDVAISRADAERLVGDDTTHQDDMTAEDLGSDLENLGYLAANGDLYLNTI